MYTAVQGVSWTESKIRYQIFLLPITWRGPENRWNRLFRKVREKKEIRFPFLCGKMDVASCFETIFPSKTLCKLNKTDSAGFIVFALLSPAVSVCVFTIETAGLFIFTAPFTITSLSWPNNRGNIRSSLFPLLMIRSNQPADFKRLTYVGVRPPSVTVSMRNTQFVIEISVFAPCVFYLDFLVLECLFLSRERVHSQDVTPLQWLCGETLDGDKEMWLAGCVWDYHNGSTWTYLFVRSPVIWL